MNLGCELASCRLSPCRPGVSHRKWGYNVTAFASNVNLFASEFGRVSKVWFDHFLAVKVGMGIVEVIMVSSGWCFHFECVWFAVLLHVFGELLHPIVLDIEVNY